MFQIAQREVPSGKMCGSGPEALGLRHSEAGAPPGRGAYLVSGWHVPCCEGTFSPAVLHPHVRPVGGVLQADPPGLHLYEPPPDRGLCSGNYTQFGYIRDMRFT